MSTAVRCSLRDWIWGQGSLNEQPAWTLTEGLFEAVCPSTMRGLTRDPAVITKVASDLKIEEFGHSSDKSFIQVLT